MLKISTVILTVAIFYACEGVACAQTFGAAVTLDEATATAVVSAGKQFIATRHAPPSYVADYDVTLAVPPSVLAVTFSNKVTKDVTTVSVAGATVVDASGGSNVRSTTVAGSVVASLMLAIPALTAKVRPFFPASTFKAVRLAQMTENARAFWVTFLPSDDAVKSLVRTPSPGYSVLGCDPTASFIVDLTKNSAVETQKVC